MQTDDKLNECSICYVNVTTPMEFFTCRKNYEKTTEIKYPFHIICTKCIEQHLLSNTNTCPSCNADLCNEQKHPSILTAKELFHINKKLIPQKNIFIHQNFVLNANAKMTTLIFDNTDKKKSTIKISLYNLNGAIMQYLDMFVCADGFLYKYDPKYERYHIAVQKGKFQFWDISRISLNL